MYIAWALANAISTAIYIVYISRLMKVHKGLSSNLTLLGTHLAACIMLLPVFLGLQLMSALPTAPEAYLWLGINAVLLMVSRQLYVYAYAHTDVANITIFSPLTPLFAIATGHFMLGEILSGQQAAGVVLICISIYFMFLRREPGVPLLTTMVSPFRSIVTSVPIFAGFLSTIPTAIGVVYQKKALQFFDPASFTLLLFICITVMAWGIEAFWKKTPGSLKETKARWWVVSGVLVVICQVIFCYILNASSTPVALVVQRLSVVFQVILAYVWLKETAEINKRLWCSAGAVAGFALLVYKQVM
jgi:drug/metabolite transporter (DMT)-like permease